METTKISAEQTVGQIQELLGRYGAAAIMVNYEAGQVRSIAFQIRLGDRNVPFALPCRWEAVYEVLHRRRRRQRFSSESADQAQAKRVAWRQILRWVEAQLALVETSMVTLQEVFLPYLMTGKDGSTLYQQIQNNGFLLEHK